MTRLFVMLAVLAAAPVMGSGGGRAPRPGESTLVQARAADAAAPLAIAFVLDASASVQHGRVEYPNRVRPRAESFAQLLDAARTVARALQPGDRAAVLAFGDRLTLALPLTDDRAAIAAVFDRAAAAPPAAAVRSTVWDAALAGAALVADQAGARMVVLLTDGTDNASWHAQDAVIETLRAIGVRVDLIAVPRTYDSQDPDPPGAWEPARIASRTGGVAFDARDARLAARIEAHLAARRAAGR